MRASGLAIAFLCAALAGCTTTRSDQTSSIARDTLAGGVTGIDPVSGPSDRIVTGSIAPDRSTAPAREIDRGVIGWYGERHASMPGGEVLTYCHAFGCELQTAITFTDADLSALKAIFAAEAKTPEGERIAIDHAVSWWEKRAAPLLGGPPDRRGSEMRDAHVPGQTDCLDEATNSTTILLYLERKGLLAFHHVERPDSRGAFLYAHATAVFRDNTTGTQWVVDSWMRDSGDPNDVMPLEEWHSKAYS